MKRFLFLFFVLILAAANWAALHDILKGEQNVWQEWTFVIASALFVLIYFARRIFERRRV